MFLQTSARRSFSAPGPRPFVSGTASPRHAAFPSEGGRKPGAVRSEDVKVKLRLAAQAGDVLQLVSLLTQESNLDERSRGLVLSALRSAGVTAARLDAMVDKISRSPPNKDKGLEVKGPETGHLLRCVQLLLHVRGLKERGLPINLRSTFNARVRPILNAYNMLKSTASINTLIQAAALCNHHRLMRKAFALFPTQPGQPSSLAIKKARPNMFTFSTLCHAYSLAASRKDSLQHFESLLTTMPESISTTPAILSIQIHAHSLRAQPEEMMSAFARMRQHLDPTALLDLVVLNMLMAGFARAGDLDRMREVYVFAKKGLGKGGVVPRMGFLYNFKLAPPPTKFNLNPGKVEWEKEDVADSVGDLVETTAGDAGPIDMVRLHATDSNEYHHTRVKIAKKQLIVTYNTLLDGYMRSGQQDGVTWVFREMRRGIRVSGKTGWFPGSADDVWIVVEPEDVSNVYRGDARGLASNDVIRK
ncbi:hypothetical protein BC830DRAFT_1097430 [Chytriomyces sp. MP71]|nr:hypothetical protein BC830DRAFT_1097430 [Chytriomyces sp. MP71]